MLQLYKQTDLHEEKNRILTAFSAVVDVDLVDEILLFTDSVCIMSNRQKHAFKIINILILLECP